MLVKHPTVSDLLTDLLNEEFKHKKLIEDKIVEIMQGQTAKEKERNVKKSR